MGAVVCGGEDGSGREEDDGDEQGRRRRTGLGIFVVFFYDKINFLLIIYVGACPQMITQLVLCHI